MLANTRKIPGKITHTPASPEVFAKFGFPVQFAVYSRLFSAFNSVKADRGVQRFNLKVYQRYARECYNAKQLVDKEYKRIFKLLQEEIQASKSFSAAFAYQHTRASAADEERLIVLDRERQLIQKISICEQDIGNLQADFNKIYFDLAESQRALRNLEGQYAAKCVSEADAISDRDAYASKCDAIGEEASDLHRTNAELNVTISELEEEVFAVNDALYKEKQHSAALEAKVAFFEAAATTQSQRSLTLDHKLTVACADAAYYKEQATKFEGWWQDAREKVTEVHELLRAQG